jgi:predicted alpha/beta-fold hydrolase
LVPKNEKAKGVVLILPGVTGCSQANYIKEMVLGAHKNGYHAVVINSLVNKHEEDN